MRLPRPRRPKVPRPKLPKARGDLWFRFTTRLRAVGYWIREKAQIAWRAMRAGGEASTDWWQRRSHATKVRIFAVAGVAVLYLVIKFVSLPLVPCSVSAAKECPPSNDTIAFVPENAVLYAHLTVNSDSHQADLTGDVIDQLPDLAALTRQATGALPTPSGKPIDIAGDVLPWAKDDIALTIVPGPAKTSLPAFIVGVGDEDKANAFLTSIAPPGKPAKSEVEGQELDVYKGGFASAHSGDELLFGSETAVRVALEAKAGKAPQLRDSDQDAARDELPDVRFAEIYLSQVGVNRFLAGGGSGATQLDTFVDYGATTGMAASASAKGGGVEIDLVSRLDQKLEQKSPTLFADLPDFEPGLADEAGSRALGYIGVGDIGPTLNQALATAGSGAQGLAGSLRALAQSLQQKAGVDPLKDLLPALGGQAALIAEPTDAAPFASLVVDGVDEDKANEALARLQQPLAAIGVGKGGKVPRFQNKDVDGVTVHSVEISPSVNLSYAVFDGMLVVSTDPAGIEQVRSSGDSLAGTGAFQDTTDQLPDEVSALVFLNLDEVVGLAQEAGLAEDPLYASLSDDISHIPSLGLSVRGDDDQIRSELFLAID